MFSTLLTEGWIQIKHLIGFFYLFFSFRQHNKENMNESKQMNVPYFIPSTPTAAGWAMHPPRAPPCDDCELLSLRVNDPGRNFLQEVYHHYITVSMATTCQHHK